MTPLVQIPFSDPSSAFQRSALPVGMGLGDQNAAWVIVLRKWIGPWMAEPVGNKDGVTFHLPEANEPRHVQPVSEADVQGPLQSEFIQLREALETAQTRGGMEQSLKPLVLDRLKRLTTDPSRAANAGVFFKYREAQGPWRLAWCWGYERKSSAAGRAAVCPAADCRTATVITSPAERCPRCQTPLQKSGGFKKLLAAVVLIAAITGGAMYWRNRPPELVALEGTIYSTANPNHPIAGAQVRVKGTEITTLTDERGRFVIDDLSPASTTLEIQAAGYRGESVETQLSEADRTPMDIGLVGAGALRGVIRCQVTGRSISNATVSLPDFGQSTRTDDQGEFHLRDIPGESVHLLISAEGYREHARTQDVSRDSSGTLQMDLEGAGKLLGTVIDALTLKPVRGATVYVQGVSLRAETDAQGRFVIENLPGGATTIAVQAPGYLPEHLGQQLAGSEVTPIRAALHGSGVRMGIVRSATDDQPLPNARIRLPELNRTVTTNALGEYELSKLPPGRITMEIEAAGFRPLKKPLDVQGDSAPIPIHLRGNAALTGTVKDAVENSPLAGVEVRIAGTNLATKTQPNGRFQLANIPGRPARVQVLGKGYQLVEWNQDFSSGKDESIDVSLKGGTILSGTVQDAITKTPLPDAEIKLTGTSRETRSDAQGRFRFEEVVAGEAQLMIAAAGYRPLEHNTRTQTGEETQITLALRGSRTLSGTIWQPDEETPLAGVKLQLVGTSRQAATDENGRFQFADVPGGLVVLEAKHPGYEPAIITRKLDSDKPTPLKILMLGASELTGVVIDSAGQHVPNAVVRLVEEGIEDSTNEDGRFRITGLTPGEVSLEIAAQGFHPKRQTVQLSTSGPTPLGRVALEPNQPEPIAKAESPQDEPPDEKSALDREQEAERIFVLGKGLVEAGKIDEGKQWLNDVIARFRETVAATKSRELLASLEPAPRDEPPVQITEAPNVSEAPEDSPVVEVNFFGIIGKGKSFAFIVDCSGSMSEMADSTTRFQRARSELLSALGQLTSQQKFFVIFYNNETFPQPFPRRRRGMLPGSRIGLRIIRPWIHKVQADGGTQPQDSFKVALSLDPKPEVIFFLTDGQIPPETREVARQENKSGTIIHTIGFCVPDTSGILQGIAKDHHGHFQYVP